MEDGYKILREERMPLDRSRQGNQIKIWQDIKHLTIEFADRTSSYGCE